MDCQNNPPTQKLWRSFMRFNRAGWHQRSIAGCTPSEIRVLFCIHKGALAQPTEVKVSDISKLLHVTAPSITQLIKGLEAKGLVARDADANDRRAVHITLTAAGINVIVQAHTAFASAIQGLIEHIGAAESDQLAELLNKASRYFEEKADVHSDLWREEVEV